MIDFVPLEQLARQVAPELGSFPLYLMLRPPNYPVGSQAGAFAVSPSYTSPALRQLLIDDGKWKGRGAMIVICQPEHEHLKGILLHELGHVLPVGSPREDSEPSADEIAMELSMVQKWADLPEVERANDHRPWWPHHDDAFIRRVLHLHYRAERLGHDAPGRTLCIAGEYYGLSPPACYHRALGDEPARLSALSFREIEEIEQPKEFSQLFAADVQRWQQLRNKEERKCNS